MESVAFPHPVPLIAHMRKPLLLIAHAGAGACTPRTGRVFPPHVVQPPELHSWAPSSMTRGPEDGRLGPSWVKQTPMSVEKYSVPQLPRKPLTWAQTICRLTLRLHVTCNRSVRRVVTLSTLYPNPT